MMGYIADKRSPGLSGGCRSTIARGNAMQLSADQLRDFDAQGYLFFPNCFSEEEIALLRDDAEAILKLDRHEVWREKTGAPRTAFAAHTFNETFRLLASHPRLVEPLRQLLKRHPGSSFRG